MKRIVDNWVEDNFERMLLLATARVVTYKRNINPRTLVSNCYEYLIERQNEITEENVESYAFQYINMQVIWTNSNTNKEELQTATPFYKTLQFDPRLMEAEADEIDEKVKEEAVYQERKAIIALFLQKSDLDKVQKRLLEVILKEGIITSRAVAKHFEISHTGAWLLLKKLKGDVQKFKKEINNYDKLNNF